MHLLHFWFQEPDLTFTDIFGDFGETDFDDHAAVGMPSLDAFTTPTSAGPPGCNLTGAGMGMGPPGSVAGVPMGHPVGHGGMPGGDPNADPTQLSPGLFGRMGPEPNTQGLPYEAACREWAKWYLNDALLPPCVPDPQVRLECA